MRGGAWTGHTGKRIRNVVNIGIGGSDLGPVMAYEALKHYSERGDDVSGSSPTSTARSSRRQSATGTRGDPVLVSSKTFTTLETMTNAEHGARVGARGLGGDPRRWQDTLSPSLPTRRKCRGVRHRHRNMFGFWDWVGGRYSMGSAIGLSTMLAIGPDNFRAMLRRLSRDGRALPHGALRGQPAGAAGAAGGLEHQFLGAETVAVFPYAQYLKRFPPISSS